MRMPGGQGTDVRHVQEEAVIPSTHDEEFRREALDAVARVAASGRFVLGPEVEAFERELAEFCGVKHAVGMSSGTDALLASLMALGIGPGDEVIVPNFSFAATATCVSRLGATPVFVGVDPRTFHLTRETVRSGVSDKTRMIIAVHLFGACCDLQSIAPAVPYGAFALEDAAQALGSSWRGYKAGTSGIAGCLSFFPTKNLGAWGDAGAVITDDDGLSVVLRMIRNHGSAAPYEHVRLGGNFRLDEIQAAVLRVGLRRLPSWNAARRRVADLYAKALEGLDGIVLPKQHDGSTWHQYVVRLPGGGKRGRDRVLNKLLSAGIEARVYYQHQLSDQPCFGRNAVSTSNWLFPLFFESGRLCSEVLALPIHPWVTDDEIEKACFVLRKALR